MIKVSVIIPVYNVEKYLKNCLNSVLEQTLKDIEIICINDGSKDASLSILKDFAQKDSRIKIIDKTNEGQAEARNIGISIAKGEYLGFVDSDDWIDPDYFEKLYNAAKKYNCEIACAGFMRCSSFHKSLRKNFKNEVVYSDINDKLKIDNLPDHNYIWNKIYKTSAWKENNIMFEKGRYFEDVAILIQILFKLGSMVTVPETYYFYRKNPNSTVAAKSNKHVNDLKWAKKEFKRFALENNIILPKSNNFIKKEYVKLWNITIIKVYYYENLIKYKLLGFIPFITKKTAY